MITVADSLRALRTDLPAGLVAADALAEIERLGSGLPALLTECFGFEVRLGDDRARTDFALQVSTAAGWAQLAAIEAPADGDGVGGVTEASWRRIRQLATSWCENRDGCRDLIASAWLEFDIAPDSPRHGVPAVFLALAADAGRSASLPTLLGAIEQLAGAGVSPAAAEVIAACLRSRPDAARLAQVGTMLSRDQAPVRLCLHGSDPVALTRFLTDIAGDRARRCTSRILDALPPDGACLALDLDVIERVLPRVGVEYSLSDNRQRDGLPEPRWEAILDQLVARRLCTPARRQAVSAWAGSDQRHFRHREQPTLAFRGLSHVKLECADDGGLAAKAYLGFLPDRLTLLFAADAEPAEPVLTSGPGAA